VICGMDPVCCESKSWMETANVEKLSKGPNQPFYQASAASKVVSISTVRSRSQDFFVVDYSKLFL
jgi:hemimethylated DNA binding protein